MPDSVVPETGEAEGYALDWLYQIEDNFGQSRFLGPTPHLEREFFNELKGKLRI